MPILMIMDIEGATAEQYDRVDELLGGLTPENAPAGLISHAAAVTDSGFMVADVLTTLNRKRVFDYAGAHHIPALYEYDPVVRDGGLMSYGPDLHECMERAADLTARIFGGARPAELPFEEPTHFKLVINLKTAKATGIELPQNFLALADEVIE